MKRILDRVMAVRAWRLAEWLTPHLPAGGLVLDVGSGTGHNVQALRRQTSLRFVEADITDLSMVGPRPVRFGDARLPFADGQFVASLLIFVLQYPLDPLPLLSETQRVTDGPIVVVQTTYQGRWGRVILWLNEFGWGPVAFQAARRLGLIGPAYFTLAARHYYTSCELLALFNQASLQVQTCSCRPWTVAPVSFDLYLLEYQHDPNLRTGDLRDHSGQK